MPSTKASAVRLWILPNAPASIIASAPDGYASGSCAAVYGGTEDGQPPTAWAESLAADLGLTGAAAATIAVVNVPAFLWTAYWLPGNA